NRDFLAAAAFAGAGAVLSFFGFMHGEAVGVAVTPAAAVAYGLLSALLWTLARQAAQYRADIKAPALVPVPAEEGGAMRQLPAARGAKLVRLRRGPRAQERP